MTNPSSSKSTADSNPAGTLTRPTSDSDEREGVSGLQVIQSTLWAALGVQSSKNRERDFAEGRASQFIIAGILFTAIFVGGMVLLVRAILSGS